MKKLFLTLTAVCAFALASFGQGASFGLKAGINIANQKYEVGSFDLSPDALIGFHIGGYATIMFSETFGIQPELLYSTGGSKMDMFGYGESTTKVSYISIPVMFRYQPIEILNIHAGPQFGFLASAKAEYDGESEDIKDQMKGLDLGLGFGAGIDLPMGVGFTARYVLGLSNIADVEDVDDYSVKNNAIQLSLTYRFGGAK